MPRFSFFLLTTVVSPNFENFIINLVQWNFISPLSWNSTLKKDNYIVIFLVFKPVATNMNICVGIDARGKHTASCQPLLKYRCEPNLSISCRPISKKYYGTIATILYGTRQKLFIVWKGTPSNVMCYESSYISWNTKQLPFQYNVLLNKNIRKGDAPLTILSMLIKFKYFQWVFIKK